MSNVSTIRLSPRARLTYIQSEKFKQASVFVTLLTPFTKETAAKAALLPRVLRRGTATMPDLDAIGVTTDELYGASVAIHCSRIGEISSAGLTATYVDDDFLPDNNQAGRIFKLLSEMLLFPATHDGLLRADYVESEKPNLIEAIRAQINSKPSYALQSLVGKMCDEEVFGVYIYGTEEDTAKITPQELTEFHRWWLDNAQIEIVYCGAAPQYKIEALAKDSFASLFGSIEVEEPVTNVITEPKTPEPRYFTEQMDVSQGILVLGFRIGEHMKNPNYPALNVFNMIYGGGITSKLFINVRERMSLCYFAQSSANIYKGVLFAISGIDFANREVAENEILAQLDNIRNGEISAEELTSAKRQIISSGVASLDTIGGLIDSQLSLLMMKLPYTAEEYLSLHETVTAEEVAAVANSVRLDSVFFLDRKEAAQ